MGCCRFGSAEGIAQVLGSDAVVAGIASVVADSGSVVAVGAFVDAA